MSHPRATYRLQLREGMDFAGARELAAYWRRLGVSHLYLSPIFAARPGSSHGYDVTDPTRVDPALGGERGLAALVAALGRAGLGIVLDIVPNHAAADAANPQFDDLLRRGRESRTAAWFDVDWQAGPIVLPFLGDPLSQVLRRGELRLATRADEVRLFYFERSFPLDPASLPEAWSRRAPSRSVLARFGHGRAGRRRLERLLARQHYRLCDWRRGSRRIGYRRFFDIDDLVALRVEDPRVFEAIHAGLLALLDRGLVDGLRIDHVDGLADPRQYLARLRAAVRARRRARTPLWVEKILAGDERLRADWPVEGTTGYEFLNQLQETFLDPAGVERLTADWRRLTRRRASFEEVARAAKRRVLRQELRADVERIVRALRAELPRSTPGAGELRGALVETVAALPVYRTYVGDDGRLAADERRRIARALRAAEDAGASRPALRLLRSVLLGGAAAPPRRRRVALVRRFQQLSGPAAAKGVEDTALYVHVPLVSRNEVGGEPGAELRRAVARFHTAAIERQRRWPLALLAATTHDTKRSADLRSRLDVLSELPEVWGAAVRRWRRMNRGRRRRWRGRLAPDANTELLLYQTLVGVWPLPRAERPGPPPPRELARLERRVQEYMRKAVREAKLHTGWRNPDAGFEAGLEGFIREILRPGAARRGFVAELDAFVRELARPGLWNALSRLLVQLTAPGVPDLYQGDELWSFSLVDPDNRRPVDFAQRRRMLAAQQRRFAAAGRGRRRFVEEMVAFAEDGRIKLHVTRCTLGLRRRDPELFHSGAHLPLRARGPAARHVLAFARRRRDSLALVVVPRLSRTLVGGARDAPCGEDVWGRTVLTLPARTPPAVLRSPLTGERIALGRGVRELPLARLLACLPVGLWYGGPPPRRGGAQ